MTITGAGSALSLYTTLVTVIGSRDMDPDSLG
jgi:hypothetical protein